MLFGRKSKDGTEATEPAPPSIASSSADASGSEASLLATADDLHANGKVGELFALLEGADTSDDEIAWRSARAHHDLAEECVSDDARREELLRAGLAIADAARQRAGAGLALKWYAILLGRLGDYQPKEEKIANSFVVKESLEAAAAALPDDASVQTALGQWCFKVAGISWIERNLAKALFGTPPSSSYDEALGFFEASYGTRPTKKASFFAGESCVKLKRDDDARAWYQRCVDLPPSGAADAELDARAAKALR